MRRAFSLMMALLLVAGVAAGFQRPAAVAQNAPALTSQVTDSSGEPIAEISVDSLANPFEDYDDFSTPQRGFSYVLLTVTITNVGQLPYEPQAFSFALVDNEGFVVTPGFVSFEEGVAEPSLGTDPIEPGDSVTGTLAFEMLAGSEIAAIIYQPTYDKYMILASSVDAPEPGASADIVGEEGGVIGSVTVDEFVDPLQDIDAAYQAQRGYHHAGAVVTIENSGDRPLSVDPYALQIIDADGYALSSSGAYRGDEVEIPNLDYVDLAPGDSVTGVVTFELFNESAPAWLVYTSGSQQLTFLARFPEAPEVPVIADIPAFTPGASTTDDTVDVDDADGEPVDDGDASLDDDSTPAAVSADCTEVGEWIVRLEERFDSIDDTAVEVEDASEVEDLDLDDMLDFLDQLEQIRDEQEADTPPAIAEELQTAILALLDVEIDLVNDVIDAIEDGGDVEDVVDGYDTQLEDVFLVYFEAYSAVGESCPNVFG